MAEDDSNLEIGKLQARLQRLAAEKASLQLVLRMVERLNPLSSMETLQHELLACIVDTLGGTNATLHYWEAGQLHRVDFLGGNDLLAAIEDPLARQVDESRSFVELDVCAREALLVDGVLPGSYSWGFPLVVSEELIGILTIENLHISGQALGKYLPVFFHHAALILSNELRRRSHESSEQRLLQKTEELDNYFNNALDLFVIADFEGHFYKLNPTWERLLGYGLDQLEGIRYLDLVHPEDVPATQAAMAELADGPLINFVNRYRHQDGSWRWLEWRAMAQGSVVHAAARDITLRRKAQEALAHSETRARAMLQTALDAVWLLDNVGTFLEVNEAACRMLGYAREELLGLRVADVEAAESGEANRAHINRVIVRGSDIFETVHRRKDGSAFPVEVSVTLLSDQQQMVAFIRDITERKAAEEELRKSELRYRGLFEEAPVGLWAEDFSKVKADLELLRGEGVTDFADHFAKHPEVLNALATKVRILEVNQFSATMLGAESPEQIYGDLNRYFTEDSVQVFGAELCALAAGATSFRSEIILRDHLDRPMVFDLSLSVQPGCESDLSRVLITFTDITERRRLEIERQRLEAQLVQAQKMESLGSLASGVAHDMNNVLGAILGLASANLSSQPEGTPSHRAFQTIMQAAERGGAMVKGLLTFARQTPAEAHELDMNKLLQEETRLLERTTLAKVHLAMDLAKGLPLILGDGNALSHALMNLCVNAVDAMPENGSLTLRTRAVDANWIEVQVVDTGCGMPKEVLAKALDPFFTTKAQGKGTGLGLSMVYSTVKAHQGQMEIQSEPGHGTTVLLRFPAIAHRQPVPPAPSEKIEAPSQKGLRVLLVDDDELIQFSMQALLEVLGHEATVVSSGEEALEKLATGYLPDVVILDMNMPGLGGAGTLPRLRALHPTLPILLATGRADQTALDLIDAYPRVILMSKPFSLTELKQNLEMGRNA